LPLPLLPGTPRLQPWASKTRRESGFRSAEGRSEGAAETTQTLLLQFSRPKTYVKPQTNQKIPQLTHKKGFLSPAMLAHEFPPTS
jgi:hypothetical protein